MIPEVGELYITIRRGIFGEPKFTVPYDKSITHVSFESNQLVLCVDKYEKYAECKQYRFLINGEVSKWVTRARKSIMGYWIPFNEVMCKY
jgi:hypothetical protein